MSVEGLSYSQYVYSITNPSARQAFLNLSSAVNEGLITPNEFASQVEALSGKTVQIHRAVNGDVLGYTLQQTPSYGSVNPINSNASSVARGTVSMPVSTGINSTTGTATASRLAGVGTKLATGAALVGTAAMAVGAGITLGKTIDSVLYNANPDFWDSNNMSSLNPETWRSITAGDDSLGASLLNVLFGFDENTGEGQAYMDETALAYFAAYMNSMGAFNEAGQVIDIPEGMSISPFTLPISFTETMFGYAVVDSTKYHKVQTSIPVKMALFTYPNGRPAIICASDSPFNWDSSNASTNLNPFVTLVNTATAYTYGDKTVYTCVPGCSASYSSPGNVPYNYQLSTNAPSTSAYRNTAWSLIFGETTSSIEGIGTQPNATTPNLSSTDVGTTLSELQNQYPDLWQDAITYPVIQDDGTISNKTYVPVSLPDILTRTGTQPESGNATQANPEINPSTATQELMDFLTKTLTNPYPKTEEELNNDNPPENPTDTGDGSSPVLVVPVGSASALWKIYHPTQTQIDSFGGWLWSSNFVDQLLKIFNNPMEAIIGLHKVYATPVDAGNTTIKVGYLDSQVPSAYIEQQYIDVNCGSVDLLEQFGNVFDYSPYTDVQLYLPFIGIVPLNVNDVMRSTISIVYGVDVITGACLASVKVSRDGFDTVLYQYSGNCAVQYPISSGSYMGIVSSIISVAGGVAATVASGGAAAPLALGAAGGILNAHTSIQRSGGFSGNAGAMGNKTPYLIISRPQTKVAENSPEFMGYPTNEFTTIGECEGYIKADYAHIINVNATDEELNEINILLLSGIII